MPSVKKEKYEEYIRFSPVWKAKRLERLQIDRNCCRKCRSEEKLHVHHRTYERFGGDELMTDLVTLCEQCHAQVHELNKKSKNFSLDKVTGEFLDEVVVKKKTPTPRQGAGKSKAFIKTEKLAARKKYILKRAGTSKPARYRIVDRSDESKIHPYSLGIGLTAEQAYTVLSKTSRTGS